LVSRFSLQAQVAALLEPALQLVETQLQPVVVKLFVALAARELVASRPSVVLVVAQLVPAAQELARALRPRALRRRVAPRELRPVSHLRGRL
jgi:hypothetical protein